jgi:hypothetical protein
VAIDYLFKNRRMRVCSWAATPGFASAASAAFDQQLRQFIQLDLVKVKSLDDPEVHPADLLIISAEGLDDELFPEWIKGLSTRIPRAHGIPVPTIIFSIVSAPTQRELLRWAVDGNWYFDIVEPDHLSSLPVRVANFLRLHDHLHEVRRMTDVSAVMAKKVQDMEQQLQKLLKEADGQ